MLERGEERGEEGRPPHQALLRGVQAWAPPLLTLSVWGAVSMETHSYGLVPLNLLGDRFTEAIMLGPLICSQAHWAPCPGLLESFKRNPKEPLPPASSRAES